LIIGGDVGVWPIAGAAAPNVKLPASAALPFRNSLRPDRFEPMGLSFANESSGKSRRESIRSSRADSQNIGMIGSARCVELGRPCGSTILDKKRKNEEQMSAKCEPSFQIDMRRTSVVGHVEPNRCSFAMKGNLHKMRKTGRYDQNSSGNTSFVAMMQATYFGDRNHLADRLYQA
jgi:hypothetical protein